MKNLDNLVKTKQLKKEPRDIAEFEGLVHSGSITLVGYRAINQFGIFKFYQVRLGTIL